MLSRQSKSAFYLFAGPLMKINGIIYRHLKSPKNGNCKVHLGSGQSNYLEGWVNVDCKSCIPVKETNYSNIFQECLSIEYEDDFDVPHTLIIEVVKPNNI